MENFIIPQVNSNGIFVFYPPLDTSELNNKNYKVKEIRSLKVLYDEGLEPFEEIYEVYGLSKDDYIKDLQEEIPVATLTSDGLDNIYIPCRYIKSIPNNIGITYTSRAITFKLGIIPDEINLGNIYKNIKDELQDALNTDVEFKETYISDTIIVPEKDHKLYMDSIENKLMDSNSSYRLRYYELLNRHKELEPKIKELEKYIASKLK